MRYLLPILVLSLAGCAQIERVLDRPVRGDAARAGTAEPAAVVATPELAAPPPPRNAQTAEDFDTTTEEQRVAATSVDAGGRLLGDTVASLGDPGRAGFWIETPLAATQARGKLVDPASGKSVEVELIPIPGDGGSRVSLAAFRALDIGLTELPKLQVYAL